MGNRLCLFVSLSLLLAVVCFAEMSTRGEQIRQRFLELRVQYEKKKAQGYDLTEVNELIVRFRQARRVKDWQQASELLGLIENALTEQQQIIKPQDAHPIREVDSFGFGIEFARPGLAKVAAQTGADWVKFALVSWGRIEPTAPNNGRHTYRWTELDNLVVEYQSAGFRNIQMVVKSKSPWASRPQTRVSKDFRHVSTPPRDKHWLDYEDFIFNLVERYDDDGIHDAPGLRAPVLYYEIESEVHHRGYWQGSVEEYERLLQSAYKAAKRANAECRIILSGITLSDIFDDLPSQTLVGKRIETLPPRFGYSLNFLKKNLQFQKYFDVVEFHYLRNYKGIYGTVEWIRNEMRKNGYIKPIWAGDAIAAPMFDGVMHPPLFSKTEAKEFFRILRDRDHPQHREKLQWYQAKQAKNLIKKFIVAMEVGLEGMNMGNLIDWPHYNINMNSWVFQGMIDGQRRGRPALHSYKLLRKKLKSVKTIQRIAFRQDIYAYKLTRDTGPLYVLWSDNETGDIRLPVDGKDFLLTHAITGSEQDVAKTEKRSTRSDTLTVRVTSIPFFIENQQK